MGLSLWLSFVAIYKIYKLLFTCSFFPFKSNHENSYYG